MLEFSTLLKLYEKINRLRRARFIFPFYISGQLTGAEKEAPQIEGVAG